jgi:protein-disulfide isomerase
MAAHTRGLPAVDHILVEFADFECRYCQRFATEVYPLVEQRFVLTGRLRFAFKHLPLRAHSLAHEEALTAECVAREDPLAFWRIHDRLFVNPRRLRHGDDIEREVGIIGLSVASVRRCVAADGGEAVIQGDGDEANRLNLRGTPAFALGTIEGDGIRILSTRVGFVAYEGLAAWIEAVMTRRPAEAR